MAACCGKSTHSNEPNEPQTEAKKELPENAVPLARVHRLLDTLSQKDRIREAPCAASTRAASENEEDESEALNKKALRQSAQIQTALKVTADLWDRNAKAWPEFDVQQAQKNWAPPRVTGQYRKGAKRRMTKKDAKQKAMVHQCRAYVKYRQTDSKAWLGKIMASDERPTDEQKVFLERVITRCNAEQKELSRTRAHVAERNSTLSEPVRDCLFGIPGAGKSHCIKMLRSFFEECLHWEPGVQFQCMAQQNTMASLIGGKTVNTWGVIPINPEAADRKRQATSKDGDVDDLFLNALGIRWLIIDECSTISPQLLSQLDGALRRACQRHPYARGDGRQRPFGGMNIIFAGDLWQLGPVRARPLCSRIPTERVSRLGSNVSSRCSGSAMKTAFRRRSSSPRASARQIAG